jgi:hypothetical protein
MQNRMQNSRLILSFQADDHSLTFAMLLSKTSLLHIKVSCRAHIGYLWIQHTLPDRTRSVDSFSDVTDWCRKGTRFLQGAS